MKKVLLMIIACCLPAIFIYAQNGLLDPAFGANGYVIADFGQNFNRAISVALYNDGKVVAAGSVQNLDGDDFGADFAIAKYNEDGSTAADFGTNGMVITDMNNQSSDIAMDVVIQDDGKIVVAGRSHAGSAYENYHFAIVRYNPDGSLDQSFGSQGKVLYPYESNGDYSYKISMAIQADGKIVVTGTCYQSNFNVFLTVRFTTAGQIDSTFGINGKVITSFGRYFDGNPNAILVQSNGKILVGGLVHGSISYPTGVDFALVRYEPNGTPDNSFGVNGIVLTPAVDGSGYDWIEDLAVLSDGKIIAVGNTEVFENGNSLYRVAIVRYLSDGTLDNSFGISGKVLTDFGSLSAYVTGVAVTGFNDIFVGGNWQNQNGEYDFLLAKFTALGAPFPGFGENGMTITDINMLESGMDVKFQSSGKIVAAGLTGDTVHHDFVVLRYLDGIHPGNDELIQDNQIEIFPNPVVDILSVRSAEQENINLKIMDIRGKQLLFSPLPTSDHRIDVSNLPAGIYFLILEKNNEMIFHKKLIKK